MKNFSKAYTLIEMIIALSLLMLVLLGGTFLFSENLRNGGLTEVDLNLNSSLRSIMDDLERVLRFGKVTLVDSTNRDQCLALGSSGYTGTSFNVEDLSGLSSVYSLVSGKISSASALTGNEVFLNNDNIKINSLTVKWFCQSGISDKINLEINASSTALGSGVEITRTVSRDLLLLNGSMN